MCTGAEALLAGASEHSHSHHVGELRCTEGFSLAVSRGWEDDGCEGMSRWMQESGQKIAVLRAPVCRYPKRNYIFLEG
jgi:hypothetical protein